MEFITLDSDIQVMYLTAKKFPDDIPSIFTDLEEKITNKVERRYFGFSHPNAEGMIVYHACAEVLAENEPLEYGLTSMTIKKGHYAAIRIDDYLSDKNSIQRTLKHPQLNPNGFCLEMYAQYGDKDVICLVPITDIV
ncbi:MAG: hypothetical protein K1X55_00560 [Chitinophagales bacterium]|nr:hypothetical protein [Chitinophagales bacterium]